MIADAGGGTLLAFVEGRFSSPCAPPIAFDGAEDGALLRSKQAAVRRGAAAVAFSHAYAAPPGSELRRALGAAIRSPAPKRSPQHTSPPTKTVDERDSNAGLSAAHGEKTGG